jgi:acyl-coenzyme A synthetase/AMP-(fatty) acid ligase
MKQQESKPDSLGAALARTGILQNRSVSTAEGEIALSALVAGSALYGRGDELAGRSVLIVTPDQLTTAAVLMELDGTARRMVLCPPELALGHIPFIVETAGIDAIVSDGPGLDVRKPGSFYFSPCSRTITPGQSRGEEQHETEWVLLTSGTTGAPKLVAHTLRSLTGAIRLDGPGSKDIIWSTFYDIRRYGGLQIFLRAMLCGTSLVLTSNSESTADFLVRAAAHGVTHISGTPSHWRRALMSSAATTLHPEYVRLSGEIADQAVLNQLQVTYPQAKVVHAFASTEAGVAFEVHDLHAGFPATTLAETSDVEMKVEGGTLRIRSERTASRYLGEGAPVLRGADDFVDTGDIVELRDGRYYFAGRRDGVINIGGLKVYPEEIEAVINRHPEVSMSLVRSKKSPITGALVVADVVLKNDLPPAGHHVNQIRTDILLLCREALAAHKVPAAINVVPSLTVAESGKVMRRNA